MIILTWVSSTPPGHRMVDRKRSRDMHVRKLLLLSLALLFSKVFAVQRPAEIFEHSLLIFCLCSVKVSDPASWPSGALQASCYDMLVGFIYIYVFL